jgi:hypothetical protein
VEFLRLEAADYESALRLAREEWGSAVRVHTRRDIVGARGAKSCEITFYIVDLDSMDRFDPKGHLEQLLEVNGIKSDLEAINALRQESEHLQYAEIEVRLIEILFSSINYTTTPEQRFILLVGDGAASVAPSLALYYRAREGKRVALLAVGEEDPSLPGEAERLALPYYHAFGTEEVEGLSSTLAEYEHVLVVGDGTALPEGTDLYRIAVVHAGSLDGEVGDALLVTDLAEARHAGELLSHLSEHPVAFAFVKDSEGDVRSADSSALLRCLTGFTLDLEALSFL